MTNRFAVLLSIPGLRASDLPSMPRLSALGKDGLSVPIAHTFPCLTCPIQATLTTGVGPQRHGVVANGFFWRERGEVEMWTAWNQVVQAPQIWTILHQHDPQLTSAAWFPLLIKGADADFICTPAPIHNPDGSESLWCYTKPAELYAELRDALGHFPLMNFWGPFANIKSTQWIVESAVHAARKYRPRFTYAYLPHLDNVAQKFGPNSPQELTALGELDAAIGRLHDGLSDAGLNDVLWVVASEYVITPVSGAGYPNRRLREAGLLTLREENGAELLDVGSSRAWALVDHQLAHVYVRDPADIPRTAAVFRDDPAVAEILSGPSRAARNLNHPRAGDVVLLSKPNQWFAYYWWLDDAKAPKFARTVDIHRKPGYDPVELFIDMPTRSTPLDARLVKGSHGYPADAPERRGVLLCSNGDAVRSPNNGPIPDTQIADIILRNFGVTRPAL
jgi:predicted AlkP superfamily pyrophosphatase or phosphodiesterase